MAWLQQHAVALAAICGLAAGLLAAWLWRRGSASASVVGDDGRERELRLLREQLREARERVHAQMDFFVNFPEVVKVLTAAISVEQVTAGCSRGVSALLATHQVAVFLGDRQGKLCLVDGAGFARALRQTLVIEPPSTVLGQRGVVSLRGSSELEARGVPTELAVPIWHGERVYGMLTVSEARGDPTLVTRLLTMIADLVGVGLHAASQVSVIRHEAERDELTGLANRRTLFRHVAAEVQRSVSYDTRLSLAMIDVDHFKHYNDTNGHQAGDQALARVAQLLLSTTRRTDLVARYGGEEFAVVLHQADAAAAAHHADRIRQVIAAAGIAHGEKQPLGLVSISVGVATLPDDAATREGLFEAADRALYQAKQAGRNRVVCYDGPTLGSGGEDPG